MPDQSDLMKKLLAQNNPDNVAQEEDAVPYDPNSGTLKNIGRFLANNAMSKDAGMMGMMPVAGAVKAVSAAPELAEGAVAMGKNVWAPIAEKAPAAMDKIKGILRSGKNAFVPMTEEAPASLEELKTAMDTAAQANPYSTEAKMAAARYNSAISKGK